MERTNRVSRIRQVYVNRIGRENTENPYASPATTVGRLGSSTHSFQVGQEEISTIFVETSIWTGLKTHSTDAAGKPTPVHRGACRFEVGKRERHQVAIKVNGIAKVDAFVDGKLIEYDLFPGTRVVIVGLIGLISISIVATMVVAMRSFFVA